MRSFLDNNFFCYPVGKPVETKLIIYTEHFLIQPQRDCGQKRKVLRWICISVDGETYYLQRPFF
jgi:hypothetical protein